MSIRPLQIDRKPYVVSYFKDGEKKTIRRVPPPIQHQFIPRDEVSLTKSRNADFKVGDEFTVKGVNPRHPNVLQIEDEDGQATFVSFYDLKMERPYETDGPSSSGISNRYLTWP